MQHTILAVGGSPRAGGNSDKLIAAAVEGASRLCPAEALHLRDYTFSACVGCEACRKAKTCAKFHDGMGLIYPQVESARGLILASPVHNYNVTAWIKAFFDRLYPYYNFGEQRPGEWSSRLAGQGRKAGLMAVAEQHPGDAGLQRTLESMRLPLEALGYEIVAELPVYGVFARGRVTQDTEVMAQAEALGQSLAQSLIAT
ncbi:MAG: flavodoxin family protein [Deltaproteobacteria bacterium]|nr:flavodoxin family protein [Deltaproteobacteria bacterium]